MKLSGKRIAIGKVDVQIEFPWLERQRRVRLEDSKHELNMR